MLIRKRRGDGEPRSAGLFTTPAMALAATLVLALSCGDGAVEPAPSPPAPVATTVAVNPAAATLTSFEETTRFTAEVRDQNGQVMAGTTVAWASSDASVAAVDASGQVTAAANGAATITATAGSASGTALVTVQIVSEVDRAVLVALYEATDGPNWLNSENWLTDLPLGDWYGVHAEWHGVSADSLGHVTQLDLSRNGLAGRLPATLGRLAHLTELRIGDNPDLSGRLPLSLSGLSLRALHYAGTGLCAPVDASYREWLSAVPSHEGTGAECPPLSDREILEVLYEATGGSNWTNSENWLTDRPLEDWHGVRARQGRVTGLRLIDNNLTGAIPAELGRLDQLDDLSLSLNNLRGAIPGAVGDLANLRWLSFGWNNLTGPIPPELGNLTNLRDLILWENDLTGRIPPELGNLTHLTEMLLGPNDFTGPIPAKLGNLASLKRLSLYESSVSGAIPPELGNLDNLEVMEVFGNNLSGRIPPEIGNLSSVKVLWLSDNDLSGPIPPELGNLSTLEILWLDSNDLTGSVSPELGKMSSLKELGLSKNTGMEGPLPTELTALGQLEAILAGGTQLCAPSDPGFQGWLARVVHKRRIMPCVENSSPAAYLTQAVQSREYPVPLVAAKKALLRVFPTARTATNQGIPEVRARFYVNGRETHVEEIPGKSTRVPTSIDEGSLSQSANAEIPAELIQPGLEMVIEVDPNGTLDPALGVVKRIPGEGRLTVEVRRMPLFDLTLIPFLWSQNPDSSIVDLIEAVAADPESHVLLEDTRRLLPVAEMRVTAHGPVVTSSNGGFHILSETEAIRVMEGGTGHYMGMLPEFSNVGGVADWPGRSSASVPYSSTVAHELGHNMNLQHAPCGTVGDPSYPYPDGSIGAWGYDFRRGGSLVPNSAKDLMSYCSGHWIGDYHFTNALRYRLFDERPPAPPPTADRSRLLGGGVNADAVPYLEPAFVVEAPAALPDSAGEYQISGRADTGAQLFSLRFTMPETADGDGSSSFAFVLPIPSRWEALASITLTGPGGSFTLDGNSDIPLAILRNAQNGQIRGILRDPPPPTRAAMDAVGQVAGPGLEVLFSRGIPEASAWRR